MRVKESLGWISWGGKKRKEMHFLKTYFTKALVVWTSREKRGKKKSRREREAAFRFKLAGSIADEEEYEKAH